MTDAPDHLSEMSLAAMPGGRYLVSRWTGSEVHLAVVDLSGSAPEVRPAPGSDSMVGEARALHKVAVAGVVDQKGIPETVHAAAQRGEEDPAGETTTDQAEADSEPSESTQGMPVDNRDDPVRWAQSYLRAQGVDPDWYDFQRENGAIEVDLVADLSDDEFRRHQTKMQNADLASWDGEEYVNRVAVSKLEDYYG